MDFQFLYSHIFCFNLAEGTSTIVILEGLGQGKIPRAIQQDLLQVQDGQHTFLIEFSFNYIIFFFILA